MGKGPNLKRLEYFVAVIEEGSITAAARRLGVSKAVVSKQLQMLEDEVSASLVLRTSRQMNLTEAGRQFYEVASSAVGQAKEAYEAIREANDVPRGVLRITAPVDFGLAYVSGVTAKFTEIYPDVHVELVFSDTKFDLVESQFDISFRTGWLKDSSYLARKLSDFDQLPLCTPAFLERIGGSKDLKALEKLPFVENRALVQPKAWTFERQGEERLISMQNVAVSVDVTLAAKQVILSGTAFSIMPDFVVREELQSGELVSMMQDWSLPRGGVYAVFPPSKHRTAAAREFVNFMLKRFRGETNLQPN
ncbi:LysR family transcriptional regulator [Roseibium sp. SCP14]|uniref:LysR family transcriptional regulator n=1 Tax=Roseibium sp. SCP14 TaxID=3141375 RepID=UPI0033393AA5